MNLKKNQCSKCKRVLSSESFRPPKRECKDCLKEKKRQAREDANPSYKLRSVITAETIAKREARARSKTLITRQTKEEVSELRRAKHVERMAKDPKYADERRAIRDVCYARRKRAIKGTEIEKVYRDIVAERDGWICGICAEPVDRSNWSLDHVMPLSRGGSHMYDNVQIAHKVCNSRKWAHVPDGIEMPELSPQQIDEVQRRMAVNKAKDRRPDIIRLLSQSHKTMGINQLTKKAGGGKRITRDVIDRMINEGIVIDNGNDKSHRKLTLNVWMIR